MFTRERPARAVPEAPVGPRPLSAWLGELPSLALVCAAAVLVCAFYAAFYLVRHFAEPIGWDTARYLDQTQLVLGRGLRGLSGLRLPRPSQILASRVGFPVTAITLSRMLAATTFAAATVVPIAAIAATSMAAGAFVSHALRRSAWDAAAVTLFVGLSTALVRLIGGTYTDNLLAAALVTGALVPLTAAVVDGRGFVAAVALLGIAGFVHAAFFAFMLIVLLVALLAYLPASWRMWRRRRIRPLATPSARLATIVAGSSAVAGAGIYGLLGATPAPTDLSRGEFALKFGQDVPLYRFPVTAPVAAAGVVALAADASAGPAAPGDGGRPEVQRRRPRTIRGTGRPGFALVLVVSWGAVTATGVALYLLGRASPAHRFLAFLIPLPICVALAFLWAGRLAAGRAGRAGRVAGVAVVVAGVVATLALAYTDLFHTMNSRGLEYLDAGKVQDASTAQAYLRVAGVRETAPVVYVIDDTGPIPQEFLPEEAHIMRSVMPASRIERAYFYVGTPQNYLRGVPTRVSGDTRRYNVASQRFFRVLRPILPRRPVALLLAAYNPAYRAYARAHPDQVVAFNVVALRGPKPSRPVGSPPYPSIPRGPIRFGLTLVATLVVLVLIGAGWALALLPAGLRPFEALALSTSFGFAFLILGGTILGQGPTGLSGPGGALVGPAVAVLGWIAAALRWRRSGAALLSAS